MGGRSIIADARSTKMQSVLNLKIKFRESFRPFAPSVLREHVAEWFELDGDSPYMLLVADVQDERRLPEAEGVRALWGIEKLNVPRSTVPAITHVDYSARIQTVRPETNGAYHAIIDGVLPADRLPGDRQHLVQRSRRADRLHAATTPCAASAARTWMRWCSKTSSSNAAINRPMPVDDSWQSEFALD